VGTREHQQRLRAARWEFGASGMRRLVRLLIPAVLLVPFSDQGQPFVGNTETLGEYDILGLKLEMTAQEAAAAIQQHLKLSSDNLRMDSTPRHYQDKGTFVDVCVISTSDLELVLNFAEVFPGQGTGPEALYFISYTPKSSSVEDKEDFVNRVLLKFGAPTVTRGQRRCIWVSRPYKSKEEALRAGSPVLELDRSAPTLSLSNPAIRRRMEDAFHATQRIPL
jgi:hypothetical protein